MEENKEMGSGSQQGMPAPQREHQWLQQLVGHWKFQGSAVMEPGKPPATFEGTETVRSLGGFWIMAEGQGEMPCSTGQATTVVTLGYDPQKKRYTGTFVGSMMHHLWIYNGELDAAERVLTLNTEGPNMEGKTVPFKDVIEVTSREERTLTSYIQADDGSWLQIMTATYRRTG